MTIAHFPPPPHFPFVVQDLYEHLSDVCLCSIRAVINVNKFEVKLLPSSYLMDSLTFHLVRIQVPQMYHLFD